MKFIRDIINDKKQAADQGASNDATMRMPQALRPDARGRPMMMDQDQAVMDVEFHPETDDLNLFEEDDVIDGVVEKVESLFVETPEESTRVVSQPARQAAPKPAAFDEPEAEVYSAEGLGSDLVSASVGPEKTMLASQAETDAPDADLTQHILSRRSTAEEPAVLPETVAVESASQAFEVPAPAAGRGTRKAGRVKTRLLGFGSAQESVSDPFAGAQQDSPAANGRLPVGWIVVVEGPGTGTAFTLFEGVSQMGRGEDQAIRLDFGDTSISRSNHAAVAYDPEQRTFYLGHGGKANLVRLNGNPVLSTEMLGSGDQIRIGETVLRFVGLCGPDFNWTAGPGEKEPRASYA